MPGILLRKCKLRIPSACNKCREECGEFYCGLTPSRRAKKEKGYVIGGYWGRETDDSINQYHNPWCPHYYTEWKDKGVSVEEERETYRIVRKYKDDSHPDHNKEIDSGLTLKEAQDHCSDPESEGDGWFDVFYEE